MLNSAVSPYSELVTTWLTDELRAEVLRRRPLKAPRAQWQLPAALNAAVVSILSGISLVAHRYGSMFSVV